jgi:hypothetical protein
MPEAVSNPTFDASSEGVVDTQPSATPGDVATFTSPLDDDGDDEGGFVLGGSNPKEEDLIREFKTLEEMQVMMFALLETGGAHGQKMLIFSFYPVEGVTFEPICSYAHCLIPGCSEEALTSCTQTGQIFRGQATEFGCCHSCMPCKSECTAAARPYSPARQKN